MNIFYLYSYIGGLYEKNTNFDFNNFCNRGNFRFWDDQGKQKTEC